MSVCFAHAQKTDLESKDKVKAELHFILNNFRQRRCGNFCPCKDPMVEAVNKILDEQDAKVKVESNKYVTSDLVHLCFYMLPWNRSAAVTVYASWITYSFF